MNEQALKILIVGGGTAGWMAAMHLQHSWADRGFEISLMESSRIGTVGVGEGTTPLIKEFFDRLGIPETEWMPECNATYKCGISFPGWSTIPGYESYFHPFFSELDRSHVHHFWDNSNLRRGGHDVPAHPDAYFVSTEIARQFRCPVPRQPFEFENVYGYHFDAALMGQYFKKKAMAMGVNFIEDTISDVELDEQGNIRCVVSEHHGKVHADYFVDCTGFRGLLIQKAMGQELVSMRSYMFNDSAIAMPTPLPDSDRIPSETVSKAMPHGWVWHIPLMSRMGNGYVYSSDHSSPDQIEAEFRAYLGEDAKDVDALHLSWRPGRLENHWHRNCVAVGLSQGFLEPLEALMINVIQRSIEGFVEGFEGGGFTDRYRADYNAWINRFIDGMRDYLQLHYKLNTRQDSDYWRAGRENTDMSDHLATIVEAWDGDADIDRVLFDHINELVYQRTSWYCMFAGMGRFPAPDKGPLRLPARQERRAHEASVARAHDFWMHADYLKMIYAGKAG
jgi:hypothetical protein